MHRLRLQSAERTSGSASTSAKTDCVPSASANATLNLRERRVPSSSAWTCSAILVSSTITRLPIRDNWRALCMEPFERLDTDPFPKNSARYAPLSFLVTIYSYSLTRLLVVLFYTAPLPHWARQPQGIRPTRFTVLSQGPQIVSPFSLCTRIRRRGKPNFEIGLHYPVLKDVGLPSVWTPSPDLFHLPMPEAVRSLRFSGDRRGKQPHLYQHDIRVVVGI